MRLTLDWDDISEATFWRRVEKIKDYFDNQCLVGTIEAFRTKKGYHVIVWGINCTQEEMYALRFYFWDDINRIKIDRMKTNSPKGVLWTEKDGFRPTRVI